MAGEGTGRQPSTRDGTVDAPGQAEEFPSVSGSDGVGRPVRTPFFHAQHSERYARQELLTQYEAITGANLIVVIDQIFPSNMTFLEDLLFDCQADQPLHVMLASPGGDGETAIRMVRSMQRRCSELTVLLPDMAKSAATLLCLGADHIVMGPGGDLGPVDPQFQLGGRSLASAKEIVAAVDEAEERVKDAPDTYPLFSGLLSDVNMLMVEQARNALNRTEALVREALGSLNTRTSHEVDKLTTDLKNPLIDEPASHSAVISADAAKEFGLPASSADESGSAWRLVWSLWCRYFALGCFPAGQTAIYEGRRASLVLPSGP